PLRDGRPVRPCLVVNPGGGRLRLRAIGRNRPAQTISPPPGAASSRDKFFVLPGPARCYGRLRGAPRPPPPTGSQQGRTGATLIPPERRITMANIGTFTADKDGYTGTLRTLTLNVKVKLVPNDK